MIRPYLRDLINNHKPTTELNNKASNNGNNNANNGANSNANNSDTERGEWKIQLLMENNCISVKNLKILAPYIQQAKQ